MVFSDLSLNLRNVLIENHLYLTKWLVFFTLIILCSFYIFVVWKNNEPTKYITTVMFRLFTYGFSAMFLFSTPIGILLMSPEYSFYSYYYLFLTLYGVVIGLASLVMFFDIGRIGFLGLASLGGLDFGDEGVKDFINDWKNQKHMLKFKKTNKGAFK